MIAKLLGSIVVVFLFGFILGRMAFSLIFSEVAKEPEQVSVVEEVLDAFPKTDPRVFNADAINPTEVITISQNEDEDDVFSTSETQIIEEIN